jgi:predicted RNA binding protein YcfA (HicA-like mRNA interferase family)
VRLPRDVSGADLVKAMGRMGYRVTRQTGSHLRLTVVSAAGEHHVTIPNHNPIKVGTLNSILRDVADRAGLTREDLLERLFS